MAKHFGQIQGKYSTGYNLMNTIKAKANPRKVAYISSLGIQLEEGRQIRLNQKTDFEIGKTGILQFEDVDIQHLQILRTDKEKEEDKNNEKTILVPIILDYIYDDSEV